MIADDVQCMYELFFYINTRRMPITMLRRSAFAPTRLSLYDVGVISSGVLQFFHGNSLLVIVYEVLEHLVHIYLIFLNI